MIRFFILLTLTTSYALAEKPPERKVEKREEYTTEREVEEQKMITRRKSERVFVYIVDYSGSMANILEGNKERIRQSLDLNSENPAFLGAAVPFAGCYASDQHLQGLSVAPSARNQEAIWNSVRALKAEGATDLARALRVATQMLKKDQYADLLLFTDYADTCGGNLGQLVQQLQAREEQIQVTEKRKVLDRHVRIHILTEASGEDKIQLKKLATATGGKYLDTVEKQTKFIEELGTKGSELSADIRQSGEVGEGVTEETSREAEQSAQRRQEQPQKATQSQKAKEKKEGKK
jgi:hypothetical protein